MEVGTVRPPAPFLKQAATVNGDWSCKYLNLNRLIFVDSDKKRNIFPARC